MQDKFVFLDDVDIFREIPPKGYHRIFAVDELRRLVDSRCSTGQKNRLISNVLSDAFKQRCDLYFTDFLNEATFEGGIQWEK